MTSTILLFNKKGQNQLTIELSRVLKTQTIKPEIFIWNNSPTRISANAADWVINSTQSIEQNALKLMAYQANSDYICRFDNYLFPKDRWIIDDAISLHPQVCEDNEILGAFGVNFNLDYTNKFIATPNEDVKVDATYGGFYVAKRSAILDNNVKICNDLSLSLSLVCKREKHTVGGCFKDRFWFKREPKVVLNQKVIKEWMKGKRFKKGDQVEIIEGPYKGQKAPVRRIFGKGYELGVLEENWEVNITSFSDEKLILVEK
jgi:hypothetical protein